MMLQNGLLSTTLFCFTLTSYVTHVKIIRARRTYSMCEQKTLKGKLDIDNRMFLVTPDYPFINRKFSQWIKCGCRITAKSNLTGTAKPQLRLTFESIYFENDISSCSQEYVALGADDSLFTRVYYDHPARIVCVENSIEYVFDGNIFLAYNFDPPRDRLRGFGAKLYIKAVTPSSLYLSCYNLLNNWTSTENTTKRVVNKDSFKKATNKGKFQLLFVFGLVTLGVFVVVLLVVTIYLAMHCCKTRMSMDLNSDDMRIRRAITAPIFLPHTAPVDIYGTSLRSRVRQPILGLHAPVAPPAYSEEPPKYESIFNVDGTPIVTPTSGRARTGSPERLDNNESMTVQEFLQRTPWFRTPTTAVNDNIPSVSGATTIDLRTGNTMPRLSTSSAPLQPTDNATITSSHSMTLGQMLNVLHAGNIPHSSLNSTALDIPFRSLLYSSTLRPVPESNGNTEDLYTLLDNRSQNDQHLVNDSLQLDTPPSPITPVSGSNENDTISLASQGDNTQTMPRRVRPIHPGNSDITRTEQVNEVSSAFQTENNADIEQPCTNSLRNG